MRGGIRRAVAAVALAAAIAVAAWGCGGEAAPVELTGADDGSTQTIEVGQQVIISLESNPTTGYRWDVDGSVPEQLEQVGEPQYTAESDLVGAGGVDVWTFAGAVSGEGTLRLKYWRSFEPANPPEKTFSVTVSVE